MDAFTTTPVDAQVTEYVPNDRDDLIIQIENLRKENETNSRNSAFWYDKHQDLQRKINNAAGVIRDYISENGEVTDELGDIARMLDIPLTKEISGTATFEISFTARIPLDMDADDFEISFDVNCESYEADDFEWNEEDTSVSAEEV
jgi:hypothetical protein